jgi:DNA 3'-phosphatase
MIDFSKKRILFFDLDDTLIKTASGKKFPEDVTDFRIRKEVLDQISKIFHKYTNYLKFICIVTNQGGIPKYMSAREFQAKIQAISRFIEMYICTPDIVFNTACASNDPEDIMRKPNTGMLEKSVYDVFGYERFDHSYLYTREQFDKDYGKENMVMIGDASGKPGDFSDSDKKTAENFCIEYMDIEDFINLNL